MMKLVEMMLIKANANGQLIVVLDKLMSDIYHSL